MVISFCLLGNLGSLIGPYLSDKENLSNIRTLLVTLGGALIGATTISFSLMLFALQINVERTPHSMFGKLSTDKPILIVFTCIFLLAISIACSSLFPSSTWVGYILLIVFWEIVLIFFLLIYAYERAIALIDPIQQLKMLVDDSVKDMRMWVNRAERARPRLSEFISGENNTNRNEKPAHDLPLILYWNQNPQWIAESKKAIDQAFSFVRRFAKEGDYHVSSEALNTIVLLNRYYVICKGKTFFSHNDLIQSNLFGDEFINHTLEHIRRGIETGYARKDEQEVIQILGSIVDLISVYVDIDYSTTNVQTTHSSLAANYLAEGVNAALRHEYTDVVTQGIRWMGGVAAICLTKGVPYVSSILTKKIAIICCSSRTIDNKSRAIILTSVEQISHLSFFILQAKRMDIHEAKELRNNMRLITKYVLMFPDVPPAYINITCLDSYYGFTPDSFCVKLAELTEKISDPECSDEIKKEVLLNLENWADGIYSGEKELFLLAIEKKSFLTYNLIRWISHVAKMLLMVSNIEMADRNIRENLRKHAEWLFLTLSWIPDTKESISLVESYRMTDVLFDTALYSKRINCPEFEEKVRIMLLHWAFKAGKHETGWATLERSIYGLTTLALLSNSDIQVSRLKTDMAKYLENETLLEQAVKDKTARRIREKVSTLYEDAYSLSQIESEMAGLDSGQLKNLLIELANLLSPNTADEIVTVRIY